MSSGDAVAIGGAFTSKKAKSVALDAEYGASKDLIPLIVHLKR